MRVVNYLLLGFMLYFYALSFFMLCVRMCGMCVGM